MSDLEKKSRHYLHWSRSKWLLIAIGAIILIIRAIQFILMGSAGVITQFIGTEWTWIILFSELISSVIASVGCFTLWTKENLFEKSNFKLMVICSIFIAFIMHMIRWIPYLLVVFS